MDESKLKLSFRSSVATEDNFIEMMGREPQVLHISCHGLHIPLRTKGFGYEDTMEDENFLLFETTTGEGQMISTK